MNKIIVIILLFFLPSTLVFGQRKKKKNEPVTEIAPFSSADYPYIEKFHQAVREKIANNLKDAKRLFDECLEMKDDDDAVYFALAEIASLENNRNAALDNFKKAYEIDPDNINYLQEVAYAYVDKAEFEKASELFQELCEKEPRDVDFRYGYIRVLIYNKEYAQAIVQIDKLQSQVGVVPELSNMKADLQLELKQNKEAEQTMLDLKSEYPDDLEVLKLVIGFYERLDNREKALVLLEELHRSEPDNAIVNFVLASYYIDANQGEKIRGLGPSIFKSEDIHVEEKNQLYEYYIHVASDQEIFEAIEEMYRQYPDDEIVLLNYAEAKAVGGELSKALTLYRKSLSLRNDELDTWSSLLNFESRFKFYNELYKDAAEAVTTFPTMPFLYLYAAEGAMETGKLDEAEDYINAGEIYVYDDKRLEAHFLAKKGDLLFKQKDFKKGIVQFEKALNLSKQNPYFRIQYAKALTEFELSYDIAEELLEGIEKDFQDADFFIAWAKITEATRTNASAISILLAGIDEFPMFAADMYDALGDHYLKENQKDKAVEAWEKAKKAESQNRLLDKKIKEIKYYAPKYY